MIPETMNAVILTGHGGPDRLEFREHWPTPRPGQGEVLIKVGACGLNNTDINTRSGWYSKEVTEATTGDAYPGVSGDGTWGGDGITFPRIQGADVCGTVAELGEGVDTGLLGKRVITDNWLRDWSNPMDRNRTGYFGSEADGGYAQYARIDARNVGVVSSDLSDAELATFSCSYTTAEGMLSRARVKEGDHVLITGASGGVGSALIQLANRRGAVTIALASTAKHPEVAKLRPDHLLERRPGNLAEILRGATGRETVDVVADIAGGSAFPALLDCIARGGRYTCSGAIAGPIVELDLRTFYLNDLTLTGSTVVEPHIFKDLINYIERGEVRPILAATYPLREINKAQKAFVDKKHTGNIAVIP